jgi:SAM-dependent methyltransferase
MGSVAGVDPNPDMLAVARAKDAPVDWRDGAAEALPFPDAAFDAVISQFGMMFFADRPRAVREMLRVLRPGGRLAVAVCDAVENSPGYADLVALLGRLFGPAIADAFRAPFALGDADRLRTIFAEGGAPEAEVTRRDGVVRFPSIDALVAAERACVWTLGGLLDDDQFARLRDAAARDLRRHCGPDGDVAFSMPALIMAAGR